MDPSTIYGLCISAAMLLQLTAVIWWCLLYHRIRPYVWTCVLLGLILTILHGAGYFYGSKLLSRSTALTNSILALFAVIATWRSVRAQEAERKSHEERLAKKPSIALEIARILSADRTEIEYYENEAKRRGFPTYKDLLKADKQSSPG
jgi:type VI protein secretion system component VasK